MYCDNKGITGLLESESMAIAVGKETQTKLVKS